MITAIAMFMLIAMFQIMIMPTVGVRVRAQKILHSTRIYSVIIAL